MSAPLFLSFMSDGKIYFSTDVGYTPTGTVTGVLRVLSDCSSRLIGTFDGTTTLTAPTGVTKGKYGTEMT